MAIEPTEKEWEALIEECRGSGKTIEAWCSERGINKSAYNRNLRRLSKAKAECRDVVEIKVKESEPA